MQELVNVKLRSIGGETVPSVNARELHQLLESKKPFTAWIRQQLGTFEKNQDYQVVLPKSKESNQAESYIFSVDMAKHVALMSRTEKGREIRQYFIDLEKRYRRGDLSLAEEVVDANAREKAKKIAANEQEPDDSWQSRRIKGKVSRLSFTDALHGRVSQAGYAMATNGIYRGAHGKTARQLRSEKGLPEKPNQGGNTRDAMTKRELLKTQMAEGLAELSIEENDLRGDQPCANESFRAGWAASDSVDSFSDGEEH